MAQGGPRLSTKSGHCGRPGSGLSASVLPQGHPQGAAPPIATRAGPSLHESLEAALH